MKQPKLTLVGAGPGDPELITIKGLKKIQEADVILYDDLVHLDLLNHAKEGALKVCVGKRCGNHNITQEEINELIVVLAKKHGHVVRLKGGDPFVFGRGYEEIEHVEKFGIETSVIPGLSSSTSLTGLKKIPLTHRGVSESFWVITGTTSTHELSSDVRIAARSKATVVILMGANKLAKVADIYQSFGKSNIPMALIQNGSLEDEKIIIGTAADIVKRAADGGFGTPAIIVIGEVVALAQQEKAFNELITEIETSVIARTLSLSKGTRQSLS